MGVFGGLSEVRSYVYPPHVHVQVEGSAVQVVVMVNHNIQEVIIFTTPVQQQVDKIENDI